MYLTKLNPGFPVIVFMVLIALHPRLHAQTESKPADHNRVKKIILTTQGGSGHLQAARRIQRDLTRKGTGFHLVDVIKERYMRTGFFNLGKHGTSHWNALNRKGHMKSIHFLASIQWVAEYLYGKRYYKKILRLLAKYPDVDEVIDTQPLNSNMILKAVYTYNRVRSEKDLNDHYRKNMGCKESKSGRDCIPYTGGLKKVRYRKILTDLPTKKVDQFWYSLQKVKPEWVPYMTFVTPLTAGDSDGSETTAFYRELLPNLFPGDVNPLRFSYGPLRQGFLDRIDAPSGDTDPMTISLTRPEEFQQLIETGELGVFRPVREGTGMIITPDKETEMHSIMLGSQIQEQFLLAYLGEEIFYYNSYVRGKFPLIVFVFTGNNSGKESLFSRVSGMVRERKKSGEIPGGLHIVPLGNQDDLMISNLYSRARLILIRSGGLSCMEAEAVARGVVLVHSGYTGEKHDLSDSLVFKGMPGWEAGNALHLLDTVRYLDGSRRSYVVNPALMRRILGWYHAAGLSTRRNLARRLPLLDRDILGSNPWVLSPLSAKSG